MTRRGLVIVLAIMGVLVVLGVVVDATQTKAPPARFTVESATQEILSTDPLADYTWAHCMAEQLFAQHIPPAQIERVIVEPANPHSTISPSDPIIQAASTCYNKGDQ